jgi:hypothetical protein
MFLALMLFAGCGSTSPRVSRHSDASPSARGIPDTPAGRQAHWLLAESARLPIPAAELNQHFSRSFLVQVTPAKLNAVLASAGAVLGGSGGVHLASVLVNQPSQLQATLARGSEPARLTVSITVDDRGLIGGLLLTPVTSLTPAGLSSWGAIDEAVRVQAVRAGRAG